LIGDEASPGGFTLDGCDYFSLERQLCLDLKLARLCPTRHYARKNIGYLLAMQRGAPAIVETDDDTVAYDSFWRTRRRTKVARCVDASGWINVYRYFSDSMIWPRGLPLDEVRSAEFASVSADASVECPIEQGLVDDDPDVDAVYRLVLPLPFRFDAAPSLAIGPGGWCPFNSQNTTWWPEAYTLMYLPAHCSFRMTDIWRSFVAQRIAWANGWSVLFHAPTVSQSRNVHNLMRDFEAEIAGYLANRKICEALAELDIRPGLEHIGPEMRRAYERMVEGGWVDQRELDLVDAWLADVRAVTSDGPVVHETALG
jgi:hypothetical protein